MPIYAYRCESCGFGKDVLQKMSDAPLTRCPECGQETFRKQVTAAGFQLKGSGWYVTDFRGGNNGAAGQSKPAGETEAGKKSDGAASADSKTGSGGSGDSTAASSSTGAAATASGTAPTTTGG